MESHDYEHEDPREWRDECTICKEKIESEEEVKGESMTTKIATKEKEGLDIEKWEVMRQQAETLVKSGFLPVAINTPEKALAIMQAGRELGIPPMTAFQMINIISGKISISPQLMLALARKTKELENFSIDKNERQATVKVKRTNQDEVTTTFTIEMATKMGLATKDNWKKQPGIMLQWRAVAENLRITFPDAISGLYTYDELGAEMDAEGNYIQTTTTRGPVAMPKALSPIPTTEIIENEEITK